MIVSGWSDGSPNNSTGSGYGVRLSRSDRDGWFRKEWSSVNLEIEGKRTIEVNVAPSFWRGCTELRHSEIGWFLLHNGLAPWPKGAPPRVRLEPLGGRRFKLSER